MVAVAVLATKIITLLLPVVHTRLLLVVEGMGVTEDVLILFLLALSRVVPGKAQPGRVALTRVTEEEAAAMAAHLLVMVEAAVVLAGILVLVALVVDLLALLEPDLAAAVVVEVEMRQLAIVPLAAVAAVELEFLDKVLTARLAQTMSLTQRL